MASHFQWFLRSDVYKNLQSAVPGSCPCPAHKRVFPNHVDSICYCLSGTLSESNGFEARDNKRKEPLIRLFLVFRRTRPREIVLSREGCPELTFSVRAMVFSFPGYSWPTSFAGYPYGVLRLRYSARGWKGYQRSLR